MLIVSFINVEKYVINRYEYRPPQAKYHTSTEAGELVNESESCVCSFIYSETNNSRAEKTQHFRCFR